MKYLQEKNRPYFNKSRALFIILIVFFQQSLAFEQKVERVLESYPDSIMQFAGCLMTVEKMKADYRQKDFPESKAMIIDAGSARFFAEKAMELQRKAQDLGIIDKNELLNVHMNSIRQRTHRPELLSQIEKHLAGYDISLEKCIALPDLIKKTELNNKLADYKALPSLNVAFDHCLPVGNDENIPVRKKAAIVSTGTELLVWGGKVGNVMSNTGMRYDLLTDSWSLMQQSGNIPSARWNPEAVWTGTEMIVYGGTASSFNFDTNLYNGARYNPITNTWTAMSSASEALMIKGKAVMIGSTMVIWGNPNTNSGGARYYPNVDLWDTMTQTNVPPIRFNNTAISTGTQMLIFGGRNGSNIFNDFWAYTPNLNSWTQLPSPSSSISPPRYDHSAVWTGSEMLVFGGLTTGFASISKGVRYKNGAWSSINTSGAPSKRSQHAAAWTGSEMIIWAGVNSFIIRGGSTYNPINDSWTLLPLGNTTPRRDFFSSWTGSEFIAFSNDTGGNLIAGDIYTQSSNSWRKMPTFLVNTAPVVEAYWVMDEFNTPSITSAKNKRVLDICGNKDSRILSNNSSQPTVTGAQINTTALSFDSSIDKLKYINAYTFTDGGPMSIGEIDFDFDESFTLEALIRIPNSFTGTGGIVAKDIGTGQPSWWFRVTNGNLQGLVGDAVNQPVVNGNIAINDGQWHQVALIRDAINKTLSTYVDYKFDAQVADTTTRSSVTAANLPISIGAFNASGRELIGDIDYVRITKGIVPIAQMAYADRVVDMTVALSTVGLVAPDAVIVYTLTVSNKGPSTSSNVSVVNNFSNDFINITWTCTTSVNASCTATGTGDINDSVTIPVNGSVVYSINATLSSSPASQVSNTATAATTTVDDVELDLSNNLASLTIQSLLIFSNGFE